MAPIRDARRANREREDAIARGEDPEAIDMPTVGPKPSTQERADRDVNYPDPETMSRQDMIDYLKSHDVKGAHLMKDETLKDKVRNG